MFTDVYIGLVKSEEFDYYKDGNPNGYSPSYAIESLRLKNKPVLFGESDLFWDILRHQKVKKTDWGCCVVKMAASEMVAFLCQPKYHDNEYAKFLISEIQTHLDPDSEYLLTAIET